jgi:hypothetical protein
VHYRGVNRRALGLGLGVVAATWSSGCKECEERRPPAPDLGVDAGGPPRLVGAKFLDPRTVALAFSEPLAPVAGVDPGQFRLSMAKGEAYSYTYRGREQCYRSTYYYDLSDGVGRLGCDPIYESCGPTTDVIALGIDPEDAAILRLTIDPPLDAYTCLQLDYAGDDAGIFVHFSASTMPTIVDKSGDALADIAPHWVLSGERYAYRDGMFPGMDTWLPIPCPGA